METGNHFEGYNRTGCGHFGEHQVLEIYPDNRGNGQILAFQDGIEETPEVIHGVIYTVKVKCLEIGCGHVSLMPMTFPE